MRLFIVPVIAGLLLGSILAPSAADEGKHAAELKWARRVAIDFLELASGPDRGEAMGLLSPELVQGIRTAREEQRRGSFMDLLGGGFYRDPKITGEEVAPNGSEVIFTGTLKGNGEIPHPDADFTMRVAKELERGKWSIRFMRIRVREAKKEK